MMKNLLTYPPKLASVIKPKADHALEQKAKLSVGKVLRHYRILQHLNYGSYGTVILAKNLNYNRRFQRNNLPELVAIKCVERTIDGRPNDTHTEASIMSKINKEGQKSDECHPGSVHVVKCLDCFNDNDFVYFVLEYCSMGDVYEALTVGKLPSPTRSPETIRTLMLQLVDAVQFLHDIGIYHRDIKPENLLLFMEDANNVILKISDFGLSTMSQVVYDYGTGSERYMAPEQFEESSHYALPKGGYDPAKADIWAIGICFLNILFSRNPFKVPTVSDPIFSDFAMNPESLFDVFPSLSHASYNVLKNCLALNPKRRNLHSVREALLAASAWTTDGECFTFLDNDDELVRDISRKMHFATSNFSEIPVTTANRKPLRTPSVTNSPNFNLSEIQNFVDDIHKQKYDSNMKTNTNRMNCSASDSDSGLGVSYASLSKGTDMIKPNWSFIDSKESQFLQHQSPYKHLVFSANTNTNDIYLHYANAKPIPQKLGFNNNSNSSFVASSAPLIPNFQSSKERLKFGRSWCDLTDSEDEEMFSSHSAFKRSSSKDDLSSQNSCGEACKCALENNDKISNLTSSFGAEWDEHIYNEIL